MSRKKKGDLVNGWVNFDKPYGMTSTSAVAKIRRLFNAQKAGHAGTLDPLASGILPIALGEATKTVPYLMQADKTYRFNIDWSKTTNSYDAEGEITARSDQRPSEEAIKAALAPFIGRIDQVPPAFSAIKIDGQRSYDLARAGIEVELKSRTIEVFDLRLNRIISNDEAEFIMHCGKGTYVRSIARDLCLELGVCGHVSALRREQVGRFNTNNTITLETLDVLVHRGEIFEALLKVETALDDIPGLPVTEVEALRIRQGRDIALLPDRLEPLVKALKARFDAGFTQHPQTLYLSVEDQVLAMAELRGHVVYPVRLFH